MPRNQCRAKKKLIDKSNVPNSTPQSDTSKRSKDSAYKQDLEERLRETLDRMKSKSFDDTFYLPSKISHVRLGSILQVCFKKKKTFFSRPGRIRKRQVYLTTRDNLIIYKKKDKGLILNLGSVRKTCVSTQAFFVGEGRRVMICRYRLIFDFGTLNLFLANEAIPLWRDALDETIDKFSRTDHNIPMPRPSAPLSPAHASMKTTQVNVMQNPERRRSTSPLQTCENKLDKGGAHTSYRPLMVSPFTQSTASCREHSIKDDVISVRQGRRSVASLRARIQRKIRRTTDNHSLESDEIPQPSPVPLVPPMRKKRSHSPPPLPANPPPALHGSSSFSPAKAKTTGESVAVTEQKPAEVAPQDVTDSDVALNSFNVTVTESSEFKSETRPAALKKVLATTHFSKAVQTSTPVCSPNLSVDAAAAPKKPPRASPAPVLRPSPQPDCFHATTLVTHTKRISNGSTMPPERLELPPLAIESKAVVPDNPPQAHRHETVRFSISSYTSVEEGDAPSESGLPAGSEDMPADKTQCSENPDVVDSLISAQDDEEWWQHSHAA